MSKRLFQGPAVSVNARLTSQVAGDMKTFWKVAGLRAIFRHLLPAKRVRE